MAILGLPYPMLTPRENEDGKRKLNLVLDGTCFAIPRGDSHHVGLDCYWLGSIDFNLLVQIICVFRLTKKNTVLQRGRCSIQGRAPRFLSDPTWTLRPWPGPREPLPRRDRRNFGAAKARAPDGLWMGKMATQIATFVGMNET